MYIILKGKVCLSQMLPRGDVPIVTGSPHDGDSFGDLSLFDLGTDDGISEEALIRTASSNVLTETACFVVPHYLAVPILRNEKIQSSGEETPTKDPNPSALL